MKPYYFKSLRARLTALLVIPVSLILLAAGLAGFFYARDVMIKQWNRNVTLQLERAAHEIDMRLSKPMELMVLFSNSGADAATVTLLEAISHRLETLPGVVRVNLNWHAAVERAPRHGGRRDVMGNGRFMQFNRGAFAKISPPTIDEVTNQQTVSIRMILLDNADVAVGNLEIVLKFSFLVSGITSNVWWQNATACIADRTTGKIVLTSGQMKGRTRLGENDDPLEQSLTHEMGEEKQGMVWGLGYPPDRIASFHRLETFPWDLVVFADGKIILAPIINFRNGFVLGAVILIAIVYGIISLNVGRTSETIRQLSRRAITVAAGDYGEKIRVDSRDEIGQLAESFNTMIEGLREKEMIHRTFGRYVDPDFARILLKQPEVGRLGGRRQEVIILMADIRGFTPMTEHLPPEDTIEVLNGYFSVMIPLVQQYRGIIVDFVGDGILAFFEPIDAPLAEATRRCLQCAFDMQAAIDHLNREMTARHLPVLSMGMGINNGPVVVGNIGSEARKKYGIVGATVNITQRIQGQADAGEVVVSGSVFEMVESRVTIIRHFSAPLKGVTAAMQLYAVAPKTNTQP
jgi:adenylate cyclase